MRAVAPADHSSRGALRRSGLRRNVIWSMRTGTNQR
jgi:hypothetical protein